MVDEYRQIVFSNVEQIGAIVAFDRKYTKVFLPGKIDKCVVTEEPVRATVTVETVWADGAAQVMQLNANFLAAALVESCIVRRMSIPRKANKSLHAIGDSLSLDFTIAPKTKEEEAVYDEAFS